MCLATWRALTLALFFFLLYALSMGGAWQGDRLIHLRLAQQLVTAHTVALPPDSGLLRGSDGRHYGWHDPGLALSIVPLVAMGNAFTALTVPVHYVNVTPLLVRLFSPACGAAALALFCLLSNAYGVTLRVSLAATFILGCATPLWVSSAEFAAEAPQSALFLLALYAARQQRPLLLTGALALLVSIKSYNLLAGLLFLVWAASATNTRRLLPAVLSGIAAGIAVLLAYNRVRFGSLFASGYALQVTRYGMDIGLFSTPLSEGLYGLLLSSGKGLIWYAPPVLLALGGLAYWPCVYRRDLLLILGIPSAMLLLIANYWGWHGDYCWGPRLLTPLLPLIMLPLGLLLPRLWARLPLRACLLLLVITGVMVQGLGLLFDPAVYPAAFSAERGIDIRHLRERDPWHEPHFMPLASPLLAHLQMAAVLMRGDTIAGTYAGPVPVREAVAPFVLRARLSVR